VVGIKGRANIETWFYAEIPIFPSSWLCMDEDTATNRNKRSLVEVKGTLEKILRTNPWIERGLTEKIKGDFSLWQKKAPKIRWKC
jgi:hypothetical protein